MRWIWHLPNLLTLLRMILCVPLLLAEPLSARFFLLYSLAGISDMLDGAIARKAKCTSERGAALDSAADALLIGVVLFLFIPVLSVPVWMLVWIVCILLIRLFALAIGFYRFQRLAFLHTYANKVTGFLLFCFPFFYYFLDLGRTGAFLCAVATLSALEELAIQATAPKLNRNAKSLFEKNKQL